MKALHINGNDLTLEAVREVARDSRPVLLAPDAREGVERGLRWPIPLNRPPQAKARTTLS